MMRRPIISARVAPAFTEVIQCAVVGFDATKLSAISGAG